MRKYFIALFLAVLGCTSAIVGHSNKPVTTPKNESDFAKTAVMITSEDMRSGGTGIILESNPSWTHILTNKHVCQLIQVGGKVITDDRTAYPVDSFQVYTKHDLCMITLLRNLGVTIKVAKHAPDLYEESIVSGHPSLLPTIVTHGHFSAVETIHLIVDMKACDGTEKDDEALMCIFTGGKPVTKQFAAQITSSLIMPGSSGSGVYNNQGELSGVIFAGSENLSYGFMVPWGYVNDFLKHLDKYPPQLPNSQKKKDNFFTAYFQFQKICNDKISYIMNLTNKCHSLANLGLYHE